MLDNATMSNAPHLNTRHTPGLVYADGCLATVQCVSGASTQAAGDHTDGHYKPRDLAKWRGQGMVINTINTINSHSGFRDLRRPPPHATQECSLCHCLNSADNI